MFFSIFHSLTHLLSKSLAYLSAPGGPVPDCTGTVGISGVDLPAEGHPGAFHGPATSHCALTGLPLSVNFKLSNKLLQKCAVNVYTLNPGVELVLGSRNSVTDQQPRSPPCVPSSRCPPRPPTKETSSGLLTAYVSFFFF